MAKKKKDKTHAGVFVALGASLVAAALFFLTKRSEAAPPGESEEPSGGTVEIVDISIDKHDLIEEDSFTLSITFENPHDFDVWVRPKFAFGTIIGEEFEAEAVLAGLTAISGEGGLMMSLTAPPWSWIDLGSGYATGSEMSSKVYDPDGAAVSTGENAYLKVPAKSQATTSVVWYMSSHACSRTYRVSMPWPGYTVVEVFPPKDLGVYVKVDSAFNLIYHPEGIGTIEYGLPEAIGETKHYERVNYPAFATVASNVANVRSTKKPFP